MCTRWATSDRWSPEERKRHEEKYSSLHPTRRPIRSSMSDLGTRAVSRGQYCKVIVLNLLYSVHKRHKDTSLASDEDPGRMYVFVQFDYRPLSPRTRVLHRNSWPLLSCHCMPTERFSPGVL